MSNMKSRWHYIAIYLFVVQNMNISKIFDIKFPADRQTLVLQKDVEIKLLFEKFSAETLKLSIIIKILFTSQILRIKL